MPESSGVYRIIAGRRYEFPDEERARQWDALNQQRMQQYAEREGVASQALTALKSVVPGIVRGTGLAATGIGSLFQAEAPKEFGRGAERLADVISEEYLGVKPYQRLTTGAMLGETLGAMAPAALGAAAAAAATPETGGASLALIPALVGGVIGGAQGAGEVGRDIQEARARGAQISAEQEQKLAAIQGAATAALEGLPFGRLAGEAKALATTGRLAMRKPQEEAVKEVVELLMARAPQLRARALKSAAIEGGTEATQQLIQNMLARGDVSSITGPGYDPGRELLQGVVESGLVGAGFGGALQGGIDIYNKRQLSKFQSQYRAPEEQSPEIGKILEDAVLSREIAGQRQEQIVAGILSEQRAKALDDTLSSAVSTLSDPEQLRQKISSELFGTEYDLLDKKQSRKVDDKLKKELPSPFQRMRAYLEIASQDQFGKLYSELSDAKADEAEKSEREVVDEVARDLFQRRVDPNSLAIGIQMREREAPGAVEAKPRPPVETGEVFTGESLERKQARIQEYKRKKLLAQVEPILNLPIKAATSKAYIDKEGRVVEPGPVLYQQVQRQKYVPEPVAEGSLEAERAKGLPEGKLSDQGIFVEDKPLAYEPEAQQQVGYRLQPESVLGQVVQATGEGIGQKQESLKRAYEPAPPPSMEQIVEATAGMPEQIRIEEAQAAEDRQFSRYKKFDRDEYRSVLEGLKATPDAAISSSYLAKNFGLTPPAANSMMSLMRSRGDIKESDGKLFVNPEAEGPMYKLPKGSKKSVATQVAAPVEPERGTPITRAPKMRLDVETGRKVSSQAYEQLKKLGVSDLYSLIVVDNFLDPEGNIKPEGARFLNNVIGLASKVNDIAESEENLVNTVNHEVVHGMRKSGFFSDAQWNLLTAKFTPQGELDEDTIAAYQSRFKNQTPERLNEILQEEAVAHAIERLGNEPARPLNLPEKTLMQKVKDLARIGTSANNLGYTAEDLISAVRAGDVGRRAIQGKPTALDASRSAKQPPTVAPIAETEEAQVPEELTEQERKAAEGESPAELRGNISDEDARFSFVGSKAYSKDPVESARISSFKEAALQMEAVGDNPEDIRLATGWFRNPYDNMWRYEVTDEDAKMTQAFKNLPETASIPLADALHHYRLFEAYPELYDLKVSRKKDPWDFFQSTQGWFDPKTNTINITPYSKDPESTLLHEVQHWIQENEGFATGGNLEIAKQKATPGQIQAIVKAEVEAKGKELDRTAEKIEKLRKTRDFLSAHNDEMAPLIDVERQVKAAWTEFYEYARKNDDTVSPKTEEGKRLKERWDELYKVKSNMTSSVADSIASKLGDSNYRLISPIIDAMSFKAQELTDREGDFAKTQKEIAELSSGDQEAISKLVEKRAFNLYQNIAGEIESRDVQARKGYTQEKRRETKPLTSENIPRSEALVIKGTPSSEISKETKESPEEQAMFKLPKAQPASDTTQVATTTGSYRKVAAYLKDQLPKGATVLDYGAGLGLGTEAIQEELGKSFKVEGYEPLPGRAKRQPDYKSPEEISGKYNAIINLNVLNVLPPGLRRQVVKHIGSLLDEGGVAVIGTRGFKGDIDKVKDFTPGDEPGSVWINKAGGKRVYQKGFDGNELRDYVSKVLGSDFEVKKLSGPTKSNVQITRKTTGVAPESTEEQAMFKLPKQQAPKLFKVKEEKSILDVVKSNPVAQIPAAIRDAVIDKPSVRAIIGPGSSLGKVLGLRQYWLQADAPSAKLQEKLYWEKGDEKYTNTATSAIAAIRQSQKFNELLSAMLNKGYAYFDKSTGFFTVKEDARYAIMPQFKKLAAKGKLYQAWDAAIAQRFVDVENSGRDAKALLGGTFTLKQAQDTVDQYKNDADIQEFLEVYRNFNNALIDLNRYVGNYDAATAAKLKAWFYSPYYRVPVDENGYLEAPSVSVSRITNLQSAKAISGRELDINDAIENFITNAQYMVGYAMKSEGARRAIRDAVDGKLATKLEGKDDKGNLISSPKFATDKSRVVRVNENGKKVYYEIHDQLLYNSLNNSQVRLASLAVLGKGFSNWLRTGVTSAPTFMLNNMFLDAFRLWGLGIYQDNFFKSIAGNIASGIKSVRKEDDAYQTLVRAGLIGNMKLSRDSVQAAMEIRRQLAIEQGNAFVNLLRQIKNYTLGTAEALSAKSEAVNRVQVYKSVKKNMAKQGLSPEAAESAALFAAMEYPVNFDVRGNGEIAQYAAALFPFVNASAQGTDVFYRNIRAMAQTRGVMLGGKKQRAPVNQLQAAALDASKRVLISSLIYGTLYTFFLAASDNEEWKKATPDERNTNLFLPLPNGITAKIPVPPEMGLIALAIPNAFAEAIYGQDNGKQILKHLASYFANLFTFSPVPQIVRPAAEVALNKNFFTWRPIENMAQQKLSPEYRYDETTTGVGRGLGVAAEKLSMPISPIQFDHLIRGYLGTSGIFVSDLIGQLFGVALNKNEPERFRPLTDPYLLPGIGKKFAAPTDRKAIDDYYQIRNMATQAANNLKAIDAAKVYETDPQKLRSMAYWAQINKALEAGPEKRMEELRKLKSQVQSAPANVLTPAQKTDMLKQINLKMNEVARGVQHLKRQLPFTWF